MEFNYDLYLAVIVANIAGHMEEKELIDVPDDENLTETVCEIVNEYNDAKYGSIKDVFQFAYDRLLAIYGI